MPIKRYKLEQIVTLLLQVEGKPTPQACKEAEIPKAVEG